MKYYGITGSWREANSEVEADVRRTVRRIMINGDGIVTGGALGVDWFATDEALKHNPDASRIRVCLPVKLDLYVSHYRKRAQEGVITADQADRLIDQLVRLRNINRFSVDENDANEVVDQASYYERNGHVVDLSDEVVGFQVNGSKGVQDTIDKARAKGKRVVLKQYSVEPSDKSQVA